MTQPSVPLATKTPRAPRALPSATTSHSQVGPNGPATTPWRKSFIPGVAPLAWLATSAQVASLLTSPPLHGEGSGTTAMLGRNESAPLRQPAASATLPLARIFLKRG